MPTTVTNAPGTATDDSSAPGGSVAWVNPNNCKVNDTLYTTNTTGSNNLSHYLNVSNFGFTTSGTIVGITLKITRKGTGSFKKDQVVRMVKGGIVSGNNKADTVTAWGDSEVTITYGSASDLWGLTLTPADVNASNFGAVLQVYDIDPDPDSNVASVNYISITVDYNPSPFNILGGSTPDTIIRQKNTIIAY